MSRRAVVEVECLRKVYGKVVAVDDASFEVYRGEIFGMVGPNGAGKTTIIECLEGLRRPDAGRISVLGLDPRRRAGELHQRIGLQLQQAALQSRLRVWEAVDLFASLYRRTADGGELLERLGLADRRRATFSSLSGGQKQRLFIALALVNDPEVVFLDELTTGLDPQARRAMWDLVRDIREEGKTIVLTTHFMEEAERLCDRVAVVDEGRIAALDSPETLIRGLGRESRVVLTVAGDPDPARLDGLPGVSCVERSGDRLVVRGDGREIVADLVLALKEAGVPVRDLRTEQPTLEDVFLSLTGRVLRD